MHLTIYLAIPQENVLLCNNLCPVCTHIQVAIKKVVSTFSHELALFNNKRFNTFEKDGDKRWRIEWTWISRHRDFWIIIMEGLPSVIPKLIVKVLNRLENDEDNQFSWKLTQSQDKFSLTVSCKLRAKTPNKAKDDNKVTGRTTAKKPVRRRRQKKNRSPSALARSRKRHTRFLEKKLAGKPYLASPEEEQQNSDNSVCVKELENTSLACGSSMDMVSSENPTPSPTADSDLLKEQAILCEFLDTIDSDDDVSSVYSVCSNCKHPAKKGKDLKLCSRCHITRYCSVQCQRKDWDFHRFACAVVAKKSDTVKA